MKNKLIEMFALILVFVSIFNLKAYALENDEQAYIFYGTGNYKVEYYVDNDGHTYVDENGEKLYILLPLEEFRVTDQEKIQQLEALRNLNNTQRAVPSSYVDLSTGAASVSSPAYAADVSFEDEEEFTTAILKYNIYHSTLRIKVTDIVKNSFFAGNKISYNIYYYYEAFDEWYVDSYTDVNCTGINGVGYVFTPSTMNYGMFDIYKSSDLKSFTVNIWTTP